MTVFARTAALQGVLILALVAALNGQSLAPAASPGPALDGHELFRTYCASCHGESGHGNGPAADSLRHLPPDLARYSARNGGVFPSERLERIIDGRDVPSHGNREMPVWGDAFRVMPGGVSPETARARIAAILKYVELLQARNGN
ncbi:MAG: cytochrome c [Vicinamibacterales bacterium]